MAISFEFKTECRLCKSKEIVDFFTLETPLANAYPDNINNTFIAENYFSLTTFFCENCHSVQLRETISPSILYKNYLYESSTSPSFKTHFLNYAKEIVERFNLKKDDFVVEIGSNDNILLKPFQKHKMKVLGIEPATNLIKSNSDIMVLNDFFNENSIKLALNFGGKAKIVCANNVMAHIDDLKTTFNLIKELMADDGVFVFEVSYLAELIKKKYFDLIYHEHIYYHSITPLMSFFNELQLELFDVQLKDVHGGSIRCFVQKKNGPQKLEKSVGEFILEEDNLGLNQINTYVAFNNDLDALRSKLTQAFLTFKNQNKRFAAYGCPAKFCTFSHYMGLNKNIIEYVVDDSKLKQGRFTPGNHIPIVSKEHFIKNPPDICLISAWNFQKQIRENNKQFKSGWLVPLPELEMF